MSTTTMAATGRAWALALLAAMALAACDKAVMPAPAVADTPSGGASGMKPHQWGGRSDSAQMGAGPAGGLGGSSGLGMTGSFPAAGASSAARDQSGVTPAGSSPR